MEWVLLGVFTLLGLAGGGSYWKIRREQRQAGAQFKRSLRHALRKTKLSRFDLLQFADQTGVSHGVARYAGEELFTSFCVQATRDGVFTDKERASLSMLAKALHVSQRTRQSIEEDAASDVFKRKAERILSNGRLTDAEAQELDVLRIGLGLSKRRTYAATRSSVDDAYLAQFRSILHEGKITKKDVDELLKMRQTFGLTKERAYNIVRLEAEAAYRECFTDIKQDGDITEDEERSLRTLQCYLGLPDESVVRYEKELRWIKYLSDCRRGKLPNVPTERFLDGGEICHLDRNCRFIWVTATKRKESDGQLTLTSRRAIFTSPARQHEFRPSRIINIELWPKFLSVELSSGRGTGRYVLDHADEAGAILEAITRKSKYLAVEGFSTNATRHIPSPVKQDVWARDGGCCVQCGATDYLEFDHIIPHSRGGASTVGNIQLLCRKCNGLKSDRI